MRAKEDFQNSQLVIGLKIPRSAVLLHRVQPKTWGGYAEVGSVNTFLKS